jgi:hypothetical protein
VPVPDVNLEIADWVATTYHDPLRFVVGAYPWGERGLLQHHDGPDTWQREFLQWLGEEVTARSFNGHTAVPPVRGATSSGHGIGKSVLVAMIVDWIMSTRPHAQGTVTANTITQLQTKTWAALQRWTKLCLTGHWFTVNSERMFYTGFRESWFCAPQSSKEENSEAFAGQHAADSTSFYIFDEASAIPNPIWEVAEGGLTDGESMIFVFGNTTRSTGKFHEAVHGAARNRWHPIIIDSRTSKFTNKAQIDEWVQDYGEDSDFVRVRVRGLPPAASDLQYIDSQRVYDAQRRRIEPLADEPLVCGLDVARGGGDDCVFRFRRGPDGATIPSLRIPGEQARDSMRLVTVAADVLGRKFNGRSIQMLFVDGTGIGGPIVNRLQQLGHTNVVEIQFGWKAPDDKYANYRAYMWGKLRDWLTHGCIDDSPRLETDLTGPGYSHNRQDQIVLEPKEHMKARGVDSPDDGDALALTFAQVVKPKAGGSQTVQFPPISSGGWMSA